MINGGSGGGSDRCGDMLANANGEAMRCNSLSGADQPATLKARRDCMDAINKCKEGASAPKQTPPPAPASGGPTDAIRSACAAFSLNNGGGGDSQKPTIGAGKDVPLPGEKPEDKKEDKQFYGNLANGMAFGIAGMILGTFFGGPAVIAAFAVVIGVGAYVLSKVVTAPKDDKK